MLHANTTITVYNHAVVNHTDVWRRTIIHGCAVRIKTSTASTDGGLKSTTTAVVRIPVCEPDKRYTDCADWDCSTDTWTLQKSDIILIGSGQDSITGIAQLKDAYGSDNALVINGYADNRRGSLPMQHWRIDAS